MKNLILGFVLLAGLSLHAANPAYTDFRGTNEVLVTTNPSTGRIIIGPAQPISTQINAAQVWTNDGQSAFLALTNGFIVGDPRSDAIVGVQQGDISISTTNAPTIPGQSGSALELNAYRKANGENEAVLVMSSDSTGYGGVVTIDPAGDYGFPQPFLFSTSYSNVVGQTSVLWKIQNAHTNRFVITGEGGIQTPTFSSSSTNTTNATPLDVLGVVSAYNGIATLLHNTATNTLITVGSSPFNFTNTSSQTIVLYLDANGATTTAALNGQTIFKSLVAGDHTIILKPSAYTTVTYSLATPIMTWTEL